MSLEEKYISTLYWAFTTMYTVGYGDMHAISNYEKVLAIICMSCSCGYYAYLLGKIGSIVNNSLVAEQKKRDLVIGVTRYMRKLRLPSELQFKVKRYIEYMGESEKSSIGDEEILKLLSDNLRDEISSRSFGKILLTCNIFPKYFSLTAITSLTKLLQAETFAPGDEVIEEGEKTRKMYFLSSGTVNIFHQGTSCSYQMLSKNQVFGEIGFFTGHRRTASVQCVIFTDMLSLN